MSVCENVCARLYLDESIFVWAIVFMFMCVVVRVFVCLCVCMCIYTRFCGFFVFVCLSACFCMVLFDLTILIVLFTELIAKS